MPWIETSYDETKDMTLLLVQKHGRVWACHWKGKPSNEKILTAYRAKEIEFRPFNTGSQVYISNRIRRKL